MLRDQKNSNHAVSKNTSQSRNSNLQDAALNLFNKIQKLSDKVLMVSSDVPKWYAQV